MIRKRSAMVAIIVICIVVIVLLISLSSTGGREKESVTALTDEKVETILVSGDLSDWAMSDIVDYIMAKNRSWHTQDLLVMETQEDVLNYMQTGETIAEDSFFTSGNTYVYVAFTSTETICFPADSDQETVEADFLLIAVKEELILWGSADEVVGTLGE